MRLRSLITKTADAIKYHLTQPTMVFRNKDLITGVRQHIIREDEVTRPDLIALEYYGDDSKVDIILKWNGISDPFSLSPGDVIDIPPSDVAFAKLERPSSYEENPIKNQFLQGKRLSKKDDRRLEALKKKYNKETLLPPNVIAIGKKNYKFDKEGNVIFGAQAQNAEVNPARLDPVVAEILSEIEVVGGGTGLADSGSGTGSGTGTGLTETQLNKLLSSGVGKGKKSSGTGSGQGNTATQYGGGQTTGDAPESTNNASGVSNDGAPCN